MPDKIESYLIKDIVDGGSADKGETVHFDVKFDDGTQATFLCPHQRIGPMFMKISAYTSLAAEERAKTKPAQIEVGAIDIAEPVEIEHIMPVLLEKLGREPAFGFQCELPGFSIVIRLSLQLAHELAGDMQTALAQIPSESQRKPH